jgi:two-component sensor histidine kinase
MAEAYEQMTDTILHDEAHLEDMVHQKEVLLREVHHRVKNNLQLIASIMNMQMRRTSSEEARAIMRGLQDRVMSLATIHRELYQTAGLSDIHADELLSTIVGQIVKLSDRPDRRISVHADFDQIRMVPDQAVPLALLLSEAVTNALKYAVDSEHRVADLWVSLKAKDGSRALLTIRNTTRQPRPVTVATNEPAGLGTQLIAAFAMQIGGTVERRESDGTYELAIDFGLRPLSDSEDRRQPPGEAAATPEREP